MSDINQISKDTINKQQDETSLINDKLKTISIFDQKSLTLENESYDESDSEYEDIEKERNNTSVLTSISNKSSFKIIMDEDELNINIKPRRINKKDQDDEYSEDYEDDNDNQNVPNTKLKLIHDIKKSDKNKQLLDDDNNTQSPAYIPRKGKFYEHDDRTLDENNRSKQEISRNENQFYRDSEAKWQHDLYFRDQQVSKSRHPIPRQDRSHFQHKNHRHREQLHLNDYMSRSQKDRNNYHQQQYYNEYHRQVLHENSNKSHNDRINNFDFKDYIRPLSYHRNSYNRDTNIHKETQTTSYRQRHDYDPYKIDERIFHRRRNFTNSQFQQQDNLSKFNNNSNRNNQRRLDEQLNENNSKGKNQQQNRNFKKYDFYENKNKLSPRLQIYNNNNRNLIQKQQYQQNPTSNPSTDVSNIERSKRYSNMRNNMTNSIQQQASSSQIQNYQDQRSNNIEQNDWPQAPPPPISYLPQQIITPQMYSQQQTSQYIPMNYSQPSMSQQFQENK